MHIHWFPGHMTKSLREMEDSLPLADIVLYVLDARAPQSCINPIFGEKVGHKPIIYILNKADLVLEAEVDKWVGKLSAQNTAAVKLNATASGGGKIIFPLIKKLAAERLERFKNKGLSCGLRGMVIGVPNTGKSTIINNLCGAAKTITGNKPGVTRGKQWVRVNEYFELLDTPGTLYPKLSDQATARKLAYIGSIKDEVTDTLGLAYAFIEDVHSLYPDVIKNRYGVEPQISAAETLQLIAKARGHMQRGGVPDVERAAIGLLDDFRKGRLGKIILD